MPLEAIEALIRKGDVAGTKAELRQGVVQPMGVIDSTGRRETVRVVLPYTYATRYNAVGRARLQAARDGQAPRWNRALGTLDLVIAIW